jgi:membrane protein implicated in regulation of membrane protease activity
LRKKPFTGEESLVGARASVYSEVLNPEGEVSVDGLIWKARLANTEYGPFKKGDALMVNKVEGLTLVVKGNQ